MPFITNSALNKPAIDTSTYPKATADLLGFMKGKRVLVMYYRRLSQGGTNDRSNIADYPTNRDVLNQSYDKIINLEITFKQGLEFVSNPAQAFVSMSGEAMFYPGMNPSVGDMFTYGLGDGRIGVFQISSVEVNSWRSDKVYSAKFTIQSFVDSSDLAPMEGAVENVFVFSKTNYLGGTASLLSEVTYNQLNFIKAERGNICRFFHEKYYDYDVCSYIRPDGAYDPHLVQFFSNKLTMDDVHCRPKNLMGQNFKQYHQSIWRRIEDRYNTSLAGLATNYTLDSYRQTSMSVFTAELADRQIVSLNSKSDVGEDYVFSDAFYSGITTGMNAYENMVYTAITQRDCGDLTNLIETYIKPVYALSDDVGFYRIPIYIHLIDMALQSKYRQIDAPSMNFASTA